MKVLSLSLFLFALSCGGPKKDTTKNDVQKNDVQKSNEKEQTKKETTKQIVPEKKEVNTYENELVVVLNDPSREEKTKEYLKNSGLQWKKKVFDNGASKIAIIEIPNNKSDFWLKALGNSSEFRTVKLNAENVIDNLIKKEENTLFTLRKTGCFGDCPIYSARVDKEGNVTFNGKEYVSVKGLKEFKLTDKELKTFTEKLNKKDFTSYKDIYDNPKIMDLPTTYILHKGKQVKIRLWNDDVPEELMDLHEYFEGILLEKKLFE